MAVENLMKHLQGKGSCPICQEYFKDPVVVSCGHSFCRACITQRWEGLDANVSCPQCKETAQQRNLIPNRQLVDVLEIAKELNFQGGKESRREKICAEHQEPFKLFCEEDQTPFCVVCYSSQVHREHLVVPIEEAAQEYKEKIEALLETLRGEREKLLGFKVTQERKIQTYLTQAQTKKQKIESEYQQLRKFLEEEERLLLAQLGAIEKEIETIWNDNVTKLSAEISCLSDLISEMEGKCQKPASEFLQDVRSTLSRGEMGKFQQPVDVSAELEEKLSHFSQENTVLTETLRRFKAPDSLCFKLERKRGKLLGSYTSVNVILDPDTAQPHLYLSEDRKSVSWRQTRQDLPDNPERFDVKGCVLGCEGFTSGRHCWEVDMGDGGHCVVGVAREAVSRKGHISRNPDQGIWAVELWESQFRALTSPLTDLSLPQVPRRLRVSLDCEEGLVSFFITGDETHIFTFSLGSVTGEKIYPWLQVGKGSELRLCP